MHHENLSKKSNVSKKPNLSNCHADSFVFFYCSNLNPVQFWLRELSLVHESECTIMLQSKPVATTATTTSSSTSDLTDPAGGGM